MTPISTETAPHYTWGRACSGWHLVHTPGLSVIEELMPPHTAESRHLHTHARQFFYVLAGVLTLELSRHRHVLQPHQGLEVPPGSPHQAFNDSQQDVRFLVISQPPSHEHRVDADAL